MFLLYQIFHFFHFFCAYRVPIHDTDELQKCLVATWLNFSTAWWTMQLISGKKDCKHVSVQKVVTLNICCSLPDIPFATHNHRFFSEPPMPTYKRLFSEPPTFGGMQHSQVNKLCILEGSAMTFFRCGG